MKNIAAKTSSCFVACILLCALLLQACHNRQQTKKTNPAAQEGLEKQYVVMIDSMITTFSDSMVYRAERLLPAGTDTSYRIKGYISFIQGYRHYKNKNMDSAEAAFQDILKQVTPDTARDKNLITLKYAGLTRINIDRQVDSFTFALMFPLLEFTKQHPTRFTWWAENMAAEAWFRYEDLDKSVFYIRQSALHYPDSGNYAQRSVFMSQFSRIASTEAEYQKALLYEDSSFALATKAGDPKILATNKAARAVIYIRMGQEEKGYAMQKEAFEEKKRLNMVTFQEYMNMAYTYKNKKDYETSNIYAVQGLKMAKQNKNDDNLKTANECLYLNFQSMGENNIAIDYLKESFNAELRFISKRQEKEVAQLQLNLDLKEQKHKTQQLAAQYKGQSTILKQQRILIIAFAVLLAVSVLLAFVLIRQRRLRAVNESMELEQRLLRSQMDPHFIFNTLSVLQSLIRSNNNEKSIKYLNQFARLLRVSLENSREAFVSLGQEIEALQNYLSLQAMRFEGIFEYSVEGYEGYEDDEVMIPPMLIQPFVENAIQHGVQNLDEKGELHISIRKDDGLIHCRIEDNGHGIRTNNNNNTGKQSLSTHITRERLNILSRRTGRSANLEILNKADSGKGRGTIVMMAIPFIKG
jgi:hypothetical protein